MKHYFTLPNFISALRLPLAFALIFSLGSPLKYLFLGIAALTDWLDGQMARRTKSETKCGAILDPIFDRLFVLIVFLWLYVRFALSPTALVAFFLRDAATIGATLFLACKGFLGRVRIQSRWSGKVVTFFQFCVLFFLVAERFQELPLFLSLLFLCSLWSVYDYFRELRQQLQHPSQ